jgi:hypothetical protein
MNTKWQGLWAQERQGFYSGYVIKKADIPKYTRLVVRYNKYYEKDSNKPRFIYCFADSEGYASKCVPLEIEEEDAYPYYDADCGAYFTEDGERLYTKKEAQRAIDCSVCDALGHDGRWGEYLVSDYI